MVCQFRNLKQIAGVKSFKRKDLIASMTTATGTEATVRQSIADIFAAFYEQLYKDPKGNRVSNETTAATPQIP
eukprot:991795-Pyramimonas_sp.AAC.1